MQNHNNTVVKKIYSLLWQMYFQGVEGSLSYAINQSLSLSDFLNSLFILFLLSDLILNVLIIKRRRVNSPLCV